MVRVCIIIGKNSFTRVVSLLSDHLAVRASKPPSSSLAAMDTSPVCTIFPFCMTCTKSG